MVIIVVVVALLIVAAFVVVVVVKLIPTPHSGGRTPPPVLFEGAVGVRPGTWELMVREVRGSDALQGYRVQLVNDTDAPARVHIFPSSRAVLDGPIGGGQGVVLSFEDRSVVGSFTPGDAFVLEGVALGTEYALLLIAPDTVLWEHRIP